MITDMIKISRRHERKKKKKEKLILFCFENAIFWINNENNKTENTGCVLKTH